MRHLAMRGVFLLSLTTVLALSVGACETASDSVPTTPTTAASTTETFSGTIIQQGTAVHSFTVSTTGTVTIGLTTVEPLTTMALGLGIGTWSGTTCSAALTKNDNARAGATALSGTATAGSYCVRVYDSGNIPADWSVSYTVQIVHP